MTALEDLRRRSFSDLYVTNPAWLVIEALPSVEVELVAALFNALEAGTEPDAAPRREHFQGRPLTRWLVSDTTQVHGGEGWQPDRRWVIFGVVDLRGLYPPKM